MSRRWLDEKRGNGHAEHALRSMRGSAVARTVAALGRLAALSVIAAGAGCEVNGFFDPSKTGSFSTTPTSMPVLARIDIIEGEASGWQNAGPPTAADLLPNEAVYRLAPGDVVRIEIYELQRAGETSTTVRTVDQNGNIRLPTIGDVPAAGLTAAEVQDEVIQRLRVLIPKPQVNVALDEERSLQFTVMGNAVANPGPYRLTRPDIRLLEALAIAGGVADTTRSIYIIRRVPLDDSVSSPWNRQRGDGGAPATGPDSTKPAPVDIESLINQLEGTPPPKPSGAPTGTQSGPTGMGMLRQGAAPPVDIDELQPAQAPATATTVPAAKPVNGVSPRPAPPRAPVAPVVSTGADAFIFDQSRNAWVRVPGGAARSQPTGTAGSQATAPTSASVPGSDDLLDTLLDSAAGSNDPNSAGGSPLFAERVIDIDYKRLIVGDSRLNVVIRPNDLVYVQPRDFGFVYIEGEIARPGSYDLPLTGGLTLSRLVAAAGGLGPIAIPERVDLTRSIGENREATVRLNLGGIRRRTEPDVLLKPGDYVMIGTNFWATPLAVFRNGFRVTYGFGFLLDRNFGNDVFGAPPTNQFGQ